MFFILPMSLLPQVWSGPITVSDVWVEKTSSLQHTVVIPPGGGGLNQSLSEYEALVERLQVRAVIMVMVVNGNWWW